jgi:murein DD-endopeptidase MepM/ murein hydrolase activator NlpD
MPKVNYRYNIKTLRYERAGLSIPNTIVYVLSLLVFGVLFFCSFILIQNYLINTPAEKALREENKALRSHQNILLAKLENAQSLITDITQSESALHQKLFDAPLETHASKEHTPEMLLANASVFGENMNSITEKLQELLTKAKMRSNYFYLYASVDKEDVAKMSSLPAIVPVENFDYTKLVSGFGTRINPWHKGKYDHDGVDLVAARGTPVVAAGDGQIILVKRSELQAGYGNFIEINHGHGFVTRYANLGEITARGGQKVKKGQAIAVVGMSGGSIAPHVHYEVIKNGKNINPVNVIVEGLDAKQFHHLAESSRKLNQSLD